jgi:AraC-like DNA-binding protein
MSLRNPVDLQTSFATAPPASDQLDRERLSRVLGYIEAHLSESITVTDLANVACLSIFHFARSFTGAMGVPPHHYVSRRRLENAKAMITAGNASLYEIALDCQFSSQSSFTRAFRRVTGMTPGEYRRASRRPSLHFQRARTDQTQSIQSPPKLHRQERSKNSRREGDTRSPFHTNPETRHDENR